jgi:hypothetical protein
VRSSDDGSKVSGSQTKADSWQYRWLDFELLNVLLYKIKDDGRILVVVQEKDDDFAVGDRIRLVATPDGTYRIRQ